MKNVLKDKMDRFAHYLKTKEMAKKLANKNRDKIEPKEKLLAEKLKKYEKNIVSTMSLYRTILSTEKSSPATFYGNYSQEFIDKMKRLSVDTPENRMELLVTDSFMTDEEARYLVDKFGIK